MDKPLERAFRVLCFQTKKENEDEEEERKGISVCCLKSLRTQILKDGSSYLLFSMEKVNECDCKYMEVCCGHLTATVRSNTNVERAR